MKKVIEIKLKNINNIFSEQFCEDVYHFMLTHEIEDTSLDNIFDDVYSSIEKDLTKSSRSLYDSIWDSMATKDQFELFEGDINQFYFWIDGLNKDAFNDYYNKLLEGYTLMEIIEQDLKGTATIYKDIVDKHIETLYEKHSKQGIVTVFHTREHLIISSTNTDDLDDTKQNLFMAGYIVYHKRTKKVDDKTLHSYVYSLIENSASLPICLS